MKPPKAGDLLPDYIENIIKSEIFVVLASKDYFNCGRCFVHYTLANDHSIPFFIFYKKGFEFPSDFLSNIKGGYILHEYKKGDDLTEIVEKFLHVKQDDEVNYNIPYYE